MAQTITIDALTAAAERIDVTRRDLKIKPRAWQQQFWLYYDEVEIVRYAARYMSNSIGRLKPRVAARIEESNVPLNPEDPPEGINPDSIRAADNILKALANPHGMPEIMRSISLNLFGTGECWLVGRPSEQDPNEQLWDVCSVEQITSDSDGVKYKASSNQTMLTLLPEETVALRIWLPHPRWPKDPDSPNRSCLRILRELLLLTELVEATASSRIPSGLFVIPDTWETVNPEDKESSLAYQMMEYMQESIRTPEHASRLVPFIMRAPKDDIEPARVIEFSREFDKIAIELRQELRERYAAGVDLPPEILTGKGDTSHWQAWNIDENAYSNHIAPLASVVAEALTMVYLQPGLQALGIETPVPFVVDVDDSDLVLKPDQTDTVEWAYEQFLMSDESARRELNIAETDAPEPEEITVRVERAIAIASRGNTTAEGTAGPMAEGEPDTQQSSADNTIDLGEWEATLRMRLQEQADAAMNRALEKAGAKLRTEARKNSTKEILAAADEQKIPNENLAAQFPELIAAVGSTPQELLSESFDGFLDRWDRLTAQAQQRLLNLAKDGLTDSEYNEAQQTLGQQRDIAKPLLTAALITLAGELIYNPHPAAPEQGEFDPNMKVSPGLIRGSLGIAGGAAINLEQNEGGGLLSHHGLIVAGLFTAPFMLGILGRARNLTTKGQFVWRHGTPVQPFPAHARLSGFRFTAPTDPKLSAFGWPHPPGGFYFPGDHKGCTCDVSVLVKEVPNGRI